jgi:hypothetical protein
MTGPADRESGLDLFAVLLAGAILFGIAATILILVAPHAPGGWRTVAASAIVGAVLAIIDLRLARRFQRQGIPRTMTRLAIALVLGAALGVLWGIVAGSRPLWVPMLYGSFAAVASTAFGFLWSRRSHV